MARCCVILPPVDSLTLPYLAKSRESTGRESCLRYMGMFYIWTRILKPKIGTTDASFLTPFVLLPSRTGNLVLTENPNTTLTTFTQAQVNHHKIAYQPPNTELGLIPRALQFTFSVSDAAGNVLPDQVRSKCFPEPLHRRNVIVCCLKKLCLKKTLALTGTSFKRKVFFYQICFKFRSITPVSLFDLWIAIKCSSLLIEGKEMSFFNY